MDEILIPISGMLMVLGIVGVLQAGRTIRHYMDWRTRMAERQFGGRDDGLLRAIEELRAEVAALRRHESDAVLSFDSTLQTLDTRLQHLERRALSERTAEPAPLGGLTRPVEEPAHVTATDR
jgi:hypothetical protein